MNPWARGRESNSKRAETRQNIVVVMVVAIFCNDFFFKFRWKRRLARMPGGLYFPKFSVFVLRKFRKVTLFARRIDHDERPMKRRRPV